MASALSVAKYIIYHENHNDRSITNLRLQKLLYFCQGAVIQQTGGKEFCFEEDMEAWDYGPVVPEVYSEYWKYYFFDIPSEKNFNQSDIGYKDIINNVLNDAAKFTTSKLVHISHSQDPWAKTYEKGKKNKINKEELKKYFLRK